LSLHTRQSGQTTLPAGRIISGCIRAEYDSLARRTGPCALQAFQRTDGTTPRCRRRGHVIAAVAIIAMAGGRKHRAGFQTAIDRKK
jgi:hypothetical protein